MINQLAPYFSVISLQCDLSWESNNGFVQCDLSFERNNVFVAVRHVLISATFCSTTYFSNETSYCEEKPNKALAYLQMTSTIYCIPNLVSSEICSLLCDLSSQRKNFIAAV